MNYRFLWVEFQLDAICAEGTDNGIEKALARVPDNMDATYERILNAINGKPRPQRELATRALIWTAYAREPLPIKDLAYAVSIELDTTPKDLESSIPTEEFILEACANLIAVDQDQDWRGRRYVRFVHFSVQEFLTSHRSTLNIGCEAAHREIALTCMIYLTRFPKHGGSTASSYPLHKYALNEWPHHLLAGNLNNLRCDDQMVTLTLSFFEKSPVLSTESYPQIYLRFSPSVLALIFDLPGPQNPRPSFANKLEEEQSKAIYDDNLNGMVLSDDKLAIHYATIQLDSVPVARRLHDHGYTLNYSYSGPGVYVPDHGTTSNSGSGGSVPVAGRFDDAASDSGSEVSFPDPEVSSSDSEVSIPDSEVSSSDSEVSFADPEVPFADPEVPFADPEVSFTDSDSEVLFIDPEWSFSDSEVPFSDSGQSEAIFDVPDLLQLYPLYSVQSTEMARYLLDNGIRIEPQILKRGVFDPLQYFLKREVFDPLSEDMSEVGALSKRGILEVEFFDLLLSEEDKLKVFGLLLDRVVNQSSRRLTDALEFAYHDVEAIKLFFDKGIDIENVLIPFTTGGYYPSQSMRERGTILQVAAYRNDVKVIQVLLDKGVDVNTQGGPYGTALQTAAEHNKKSEVIQLLLDKGANVNAQGGEFGTALQAAAFRGNVEFTQLLLCNGADVNAQGGEYGTALQAAAHCCGPQVGDNLSLRPQYNVEVARLLLDKGADVNAQGGRYGNALQAAVQVWCFLAPPCTIKNPFFRSSG